MATTIIPRSDYMDGKVTHSDYYGQFVTPAVTALVVGTLNDAVLRSNDPHLNDVPLHRWDRLAAFVPDESLRMIAAASTGGVSLSDRVCVLKEAARRLRDQSRAAYLARGSR